MEKLADFVSSHISDDPVRLIMNRDRWPEIDMDMAVNSIESRRKLRDKVREWHDEPRLVFPLKLSAEQCSSSATGRYKAGLASRISCKESWAIADLTGGLGVDSWFFSQKAERVLYNEMQEVLCRAAEHNFKVLEAGNISVSNGIARQGDIEKILDGFNPDIVYMDPARRGEGGRKVFLIEDCTPDVLTLKDEIFKEKLGCVSTRELIRSAKERNNGSMGYAEAMLSFYNRRMKPGLPWGKLYSAKSKGKKYTIPPAMAGQAGMFEATYDDTFDEEPFDDTDGSGY